MPKWFDTITVLLVKPFKNQANINEVKLCGGYEAGSYIKF